MADFDLDGMTDEQLLALIKNAGKPEVKNKQKVKVQTINGEVLKADSVEELNQLLVQKLAAAQRVVEEEPEPVNNNVNQNQPRLPKFDYKKFEETFVKDPVAGQEYLETTQYGAPLKTLLPQIGGAVGALMKKVQELEAQQFIDQNPDYEPSVENRKAIERVMTERGWQPSRQTLEDAFAIAAAKGQIKGKSTIKGQKEEVDNEQFIPPRGRSAADISNGDQELLNNLNNLSDEKIFELANKAGIGPRR